MRINKHLMAGPSVALSWIFAKSKKDVSCSRLVWRHRRNIGWHLQKISNYNCSSFCLSSNITARPLYLFSLNLSGLVASHQYFLFFSNILFIDIILYLPYKWKKNLLSDLLLKRIVITPGFQPNEIHISSNASTVQ